MCSRFGKTTRTLRMILRCEILGEILTLCRARDTTETIVEIESEIGGIGGIGEIVGIETEIESAEEAGRPITDRDETTRIRIPRAETTGPENEKIVTAIDATNENGTETEHLAGGMMGDRLDEIAIFSTTEEAEVVVTATETRSVA